jgi:hypothetical protein
MLDTNTRVVHFRPVPKHCLLLPFSQRLEHGLQASICINHFGCSLDFAPLLLSAIGWTSLPLLPLLPLLSLLSLLSLLPLLPLLLLLLLLLLLSLLLSLLVLLVLALMVRLAMLIVVGVLV